MAWLLELDVPEIKQDICYPKPVTSQYVLIWFVRAEPIHIATVSEVTIRTIHLHAAPFMTHSDMALKQAKWQSSNESSFEHLWLTFSPGELG